MKIIYSPQAIGELRAISAYLKPRSPEGAKRVRAAIINALAHLEMFPHAGTRQKNRGRS